MRDFRWPAGLSPVVWGDRLYLLTAIPAGVASGETHQPRGGVSPRVLHA